MPAIDEVKNTIEYYTAVTTRNIEVSSDSPPTFDGMTVVREMMMPAGRGMFPDDFDVQSPQLQVLEISRFRPMVTDDKLRFLSRMQHLDTVNIG